MTASTISGCVYNLDEVVVHAEEVHDAMEKRRPHPGENGPVGLRIDLRNDVCEIQKSGIRLRPRVTLNLGDRFALRKASGLVEAPERRTAVGMENRGALRVLVPGIGANPAAAVVWPVSLPKERRAIRLQPS